MAITKEMIESLEPDKKAEALAIIAELNKRGSLSPNDVSVDLLRPPTGTINRTMGSGKGILPQVANALSFALRGKTMDTGTDDFAEKLALIEARKTQTQPKIMKVGRNVVQIDPASGVTETLIEAEKSPADRKAELDLADRERQTKLASENTITAAEDTLNTIGEVKKGLKYFGVVGKIPTLNPWGFERKEWESNINKLLSQKIVDLMNTMKQASRTGATGFGQLNKSELLLLQNASTALRKDLSPEQAKKYLDAMEVIAKKVATPSMAGQQVDSVNEDEVDLGSF